MTLGAPRLWWIAGAVVATAGFALVVGVTLLSADIEAAECGAGGPAVAPSAAALSDIPGNYLELYQAAATEEQLGGDGWSYLAGVGSRETDHGRLEALGVSSGENSAGAGGPMQFLTGTPGRSSASTATTTAARTGTIRATRSRPRPAT